MCASAELSKKSALTPQVETLLEEFCESDLLEHYLERPSTAMAEQLVSEEMARRRNSGTEPHPGSAKASATEPWRGDQPTPPAEAGGQHSSSKVAANRPSSALAEQLVSEEIAMSRWLKEAGGNFERPSTALAEALVSEEIAGRRSTREANDPPASDAAGEQVLHHVASPKLLESVARDQRPSTAQAEELIMEEIQSRRHEDLCKVTATGVGISGPGAAGLFPEGLPGDDFVNPAEIARPSTAQAEQLVLEEIKSMVASGPWSPAATPIDTTRPSTAHAEQLVAEEIQQHRVQAETMMMRH
mmetsp:Transcript_92913/g.262997  ORF Transcript_92913/g.262997 Transcript_92913/m.262997 type:complete len:301 (+) Transcript_92913:181-1083(+)